jgi:RNA-directed DNA polymerase
MEEVCAQDNCKQALKRVKANKGSPGADGMTVQELPGFLQQHWPAIREQLLNGTYQPQPVRRKEIDKPDGGGVRKLGIPTVLDRFIQQAVMQVLQGRWDRTFSDHSYGFRPGRSAHQAVKAAQEYIAAGYRWVVDLDLEKFFDTIPHSALIGRVKEKVADGRVLELLQAFLTQKVMATAEGWTPEEGTPQGAVVSPLLSNIYLHPLDQQMAQRGYEMIRYADDFVILCRSEAEARAALAEVQAWTASVGLTLHPTKTRIVDATQIGGFDFLGYHFEAGRKWPRAKSLGKFKDSIRGKTRRTQGQSLSVIITGVNRTLRGWFAYFQHSHRFTFEVLDSWVRMRLRSILRRRQGRRGRGRGADHHRWLNDFFTAQGLFSLVAAHDAVCQSSRR